MGRPRSGRAVARLRAKGAGGGVSPQEAVVVFWCDSYPHHVAGYSYSSFFKGEKQHYRVRGVVIPRKKGWLFPAIGVVIPRIRGVVIPCGELHLCTAYPQTYSPLSKVSVLETHRFRRVASTRVVMGVWGAMERKIGIRKFYPYKPYGWRRLLSGSDIPCLPGIGALDWAAAVIPRGQCRERGGDSARSRQERGVVIPPLLPHLKGASGVVIPRDRHEARCEEFIRSNALRGW